VAFYESTDDPAVFHATPWTAGPWTPEHQHAGPPSALLARTVERTASSIAGAQQITRLSFDILGPIAVDAVTVRAEVTRPGRTVELVEGELQSGGRPALRVRAWRMRTAELTLPDELGRPDAAPPVPADAGSGDGLPGAGYLHAIEWRFVHGHLVESGPARAWTRLRVPIVAGEEPSGTQRLLTVADSGNGLSSLLSWNDWWFINTDLTVHLHRVPTGEWIYLDARSTLDPSGVGLAETELYDGRGRVGRGAQSLMVGPRRA
jgi:hypothetical protein